MGVPRRAGSPCREAGRAVARAGVRLRTAVALACGLAFAALAGCATPPPRPSLPDLSPDAVGTPAQAERALALTEAERLRLAPVWARREYDCYQGFFVTRCLERFRGERRRVEQHLRGIDVRARQVLRDDEALRRNAAEADSLAEAAATAAEDAARREAAARERDARLRDQAAEQARREDEALRLERERPQAERRQAEREAEAAARQRDKAREVDEAARRPPRASAPPTPKASSTRPGP